MIFSAAITKPMKPLPDLLAGMDETDKIPGFSDSDGTDPQEDAQSEPNPPDDPPERPTKQRVHEMDLDYGSHDLPERPKLPPRQPLGTVRSKKYKKVPSSVNTKYTQPYCRRPLPLVPYETLDESSESPVESVPSPTSPTKGPSPKDPTSSTKGITSPHGKEPQEEAQSKPIRVVNFGRIDDMNPVFDSHVFPQRLKLPRQPLGTVRSKEKDTKGLVLVPLQSHVHSHLVNHVHPGRPELPPHQPMGTVKSKTDKKVPSRNKEYTLSHFRRPLPPVPYEMLDESFESPAESVAGLTSPTKGPSSPVEGPTSPTKGTTYPYKDPTASLEGITSRKVARVKGVSQQKIAVVVPMQPVARDIPKQQTDGTILKQRSELPVDVHTKQPPVLKTAASLSPSNQQSKITATTIQQHRSSLRPVNPKSQSNTEEVYGGLAEVSIQLFFGLFLRKDWTRHKHDNALSSLNLERE